MCVHVSICTPTLFGKLGCMFQCPVSLDCPSEGPVHIQKLVLKNLRKICFAFFYCSHPDGLKLPHTEKQSENVEFSGGSGGWLAIFTMGSLSSEGAMSSVIQSPTNPSQTLIPTSPHRTHSHATLEPWRRGAVGLIQGRLGLLEGLLWTPKLNVGPGGWLLKYSQGGLSVCVSACTFYF